MSATETKDLGSIPGWVKPIIIKNWYLQLPCLTFSIERDSVPPPSVVNRWAGGTLTRKRQGTFVVSGQGNLVNKMQLQ